MKETILCGGTVLNGEFRWEKKDIVIRDGKIVAFSEPGQESGVDISGKLVIPGLMDTHIHGAAGTDTMSGDFEPISAFLVQHGVTSFLPTTMTRPICEIQHILHADTKVSGAQILGFHLEGPYINVKHKGAQNEAYIKSPDWNDFGENPLIKMVTVAPELEGSEEYISRASKHFTVALGHSDCDYETACRALEAGASSVTHLCNAMSAFHHRKPGLLGAGLERDEFYTQVIADGIHSHTAVLRLIYRCKGADRMVLISDAMAAAGLEDGTYDLGGLAVHVRGGEARIASGNLAGSTTNLWDCVCLLERIGIPFEDAVKMASLTPAKMIGVTGKGALNEGYDADLVITDSDRTIHCVMIGGEWADIS